MRNERGARCTVTVKTQVQGLIDESDYEGRQAERGENRRRGVNSAMDHSNKKLATFHIEYKI